MSDQDLEPHEPAAAQPDPAWVQSFNDRYGLDAYRDLLGAFDKPCVSYAETAARFGVTRERVRQWHLLLMPNAPRGHERRRLCRSYHQKRRLLTDPLFRAFVRAARPFFPPSRSDRSRRATDFGNARCRLQAQTVVLKQAARSHQRDTVLPRGPAYALTSSRGNADFIFYQLSADDYLFVPKALIPLAGTTFLDTSRPSINNSKTPSAPPRLAPDGADEVVEPSVILRSQAG